MVCPLKKKRRCVQYARLHMDLVGHGLISRPDGDTEFASRVALRALRDRAHRAWGAFPWYVCTGWQNELSLHTSAHRIASWVTHRHARFSSKPASRTAPPLQRGTCWRCVGKVKAETQIHAGGPCRDGIARMEVRQEEYILRTRGQRRPLLLNSYPRLPGRPRWAWVSNFRVRGCLDELPANQNSQNLVGTNFGLLLARQTPTDVGPKVLTPYQKGWDPGKYYYKYNGSLMLRATYYYYICNRADRQQQQNSGPNEDIKV